MFAGEGFVISAVAYDFIIRNGTVSVFDIVLENRVRILNVDGKGMKRWELVEASPTLLQRVESKADEKKVVESKQPNLSRVLRVHLEYGVEQQYAMTVLTETELKGAGNVSLPVFRCGEMVSREKGFIAVEARTNLELGLVTSSGVSVIDNSELEARLFKETQNPLLFSFKFLEPEVAIELSVIKHADVPVLIAVIDKAHVISTQSEEGRLLTKIVASVRNTQRQFLRVVSLAF